MPIPAYQKIKTGLSVENAKSYFRIFLFILLLAASHHGVAANRYSSQSLIIKFSDQVQDKINKGQATRSLIMKTLSEHVQHKLSYKRAMSGNAHVISLPFAESKNSTESIIELLRQNPSIKRVETNPIVFPLTNPADYYYPDQWPLHESQSIPSGMNLPAAWDLTTGSANTVVAVIDTGILPFHIDLQGRLLPGYDFISEFELGNNALLEQFPSYLTHFRTNDGDGRDSDPSDPGDWVDIDDSQAMMSVGVECNIQDSTFHGTAIASIIAANSQHTHGIAGIDWNAKILPIRVSGKCGGSRADMIDAIRWAAGVSDPSLPPNPYPASVINLSLGTNNPCGISEQEAINDAWMAGSVLIAAVGNDANNLQFTAVSPAVCEHVISVAAVRQDGTRAYYSNYGTAVDIAAPGGEDANSDGIALLAATNHGLKESIEQASHYKYVAGTSAAAAHASGVAALMRGANPALSPGQIEQLLLQSTRAFPQNGLLNCDTLTCGVGLIDAHRAVAAAIDGYVQGYEPATGAGNQAQANNVPPLIETGIRGAGGCSINRTNEQDPSLYFIVIFLWLIRKHSRLSSRPHFHRFTLLIKS